MRSILPKNTPVAAGVYIFKKGSAPLYIGKALNLKTRLASYFRKNVSSKIALMLGEATKLDLIETSSDIEALILEAELIKRYRPKYNYMLRDDKNYFYVGFTKEKFPRIFLTHQPERTTRGMRHATKYTGPFTDGTAIKTTLRMLRKVFPYCTCARLHSRPCLNAEIGRCLGFCCVKSGLTPSSRLQLARYTENIKRIAAILSGKKKKILTALKREMRTAAKNQEYERAARLRDQIRGVENVFRHRPVLMETEAMTEGNAHMRRDWKKIEKTLQTILGIKKPITRIEGYDISNISGLNATGSMVVFMRGLPQKTAYRQFKIHSVKGPDDVAMHKEVLRRRLAHPEWTLPDLMLIDGGKPQLGAAREALGARYRRLVFLAALAKREEKLYLPHHRFPLRLASLPDHTARLLQHIRNESHRFAKRYHHSLRKMWYHKNGHAKG